MKAREIYQLFLKGVRPIIECTEEVLKLECDPDPHMRGRIKNIQIEDQGEEWEHLLFIIDFGEFEEYNVSFGRSNYYNDKGIPCETWFQQSYYQGNKNAVSIYVEYGDESFSIVGDSLYDEFLNSKSDLSYVKWLENEVKELKKYKLMLCSKNMGFKLKDGV